MFSSLVDQYRKKSVVFEARKPAAPKVVEPKKELPKIKIDTKLDPDIEYWSVEILNPPIKINSKDDGIVEHPYCLVLEWQGNKLISYLTYNELIQETKNLFGVE